MHFQCSIATADDTLPTFKLRPASNLQNVAVDRKQILMIICSLDSKEAHGCNEASIAMITICGLSIAEPLCLIYDKFLKKETFPLIVSKQI